MDYLVFFKNNIYADILEAEFDSIELVVELTPRPGSGGRTWRRQQRCRAQIAASTASGGRTIAGARTRAPAGPGQS